MTVTLTTQGGQLDSGLSVVSYSFISASAVTTSLPAKSTVMASRNSTQAIPGSNVFTTIVPNVISLDTMSELSAGFFTPKLTSGGGTSAATPVQYLVQLYAGVSVNQVYTISFFNGGSQVPNLGPAIVTGTTTSDLAWSGLILLDPGTPLDVRISAPSGFNLGGGTGTLLRYFITRLTP